MSPRPRLRRLAPLPLLLILANAGCGAPAMPEFHSLLSEQPQVLEASPGDGSVLQDPVELSLRFSERVNMKSLGPDSVAVLRGLPDASLLKETQSLEEKLSAGEIPSLPVQYLLDIDERGVTLLPETGLEPGVYAVVVTPKLLSVRGVPFNQKPGETPTVFLARFTYGDVPAGSLDPAPSGGSGPGGPVFGAAPEQLVLEEFLYDGKVSDTDGESFVELYGTPAGDISLYQILFINGEDGAETERITLPPNSIIPDDGIFLIADLRTSSTTISKVPDADYLDQFDPQNGPDGIQLLNRDGKLLDSVTYGTGAVTTAQNGLPLGEGNPAKDVTAGHSLGRIQGKDSQDNGVDFIDMATPSPGQFN